MYCLLIFYQKETYICLHLFQAWREERANKMDMSLIEKRKEDNVYNALKSTFTGDIIRMALIEAQFIKKGEKIVLLWLS